MITSINGHSANEVWEKAHTILLSQSKIQNSRLGISHELLHVCFSISDPRQRWVTSRAPAINPAFAIAELFWIVAGREDASFINHWNPALPKFAGKGASYSGAYGQRIRQNFDFDQLSAAYQSLKSNPNSRQVVIQIWSPQRDFPHSNGTPRHADIPCNICSFPKIRNGKLEWFQLMRSNDLYLGTPYNFIQFTMLHEILAGWLEVELGSYNHLSDSLHVYDHDIASLSTIPVQNQATTDNLALSKKEFDLIFPELILFLDNLSKGFICRSAFATSIQKISAPTSYKNLLCIAAADSARRRGWLEEMDIAANTCTNATLCNLWTNWNNRWNSPNNSQQAS